jgi:hypothetical protein
MEWVSTGAKGLVEGCCEHGNEPSVSIKHVTQIALAASHSGFPYERSCTVGFCCQAPTYLRFKVLLSTLCGEQFMEKQMDKACSTHETHDKHVQNIPSFNNTEHDTRTGRRRQNNIKMGFS